MVALATDPAAGWDRRLWLLWALYTALGYTTILAVVWLLSGLGLDAVGFAERSALVGTLVVASGGALLYGAVLGTLQWRVLRERIPMPRRTWIGAALVPAVLVWAASVVPTAVNADRAHQDVRVAYVLAVGQALALGPVIGFSQAWALRRYSRRWRWWTAANLCSWLLVYLVFWLVSLVDGFDFAHGRGTPLEAYLMLLVSAPISGRWLLWVLAPGALLGVQQPARARSHRGGVGTPGAPGTAGGR